MSDKTLGQIAYEAFSSKRNFMVPEWDVLHTEVQDAWQSVANAIDSEVKRRLAKCNTVP